MNYDSLLVCLNIILYFCKRFKQIRSKMLFFLRHQILNDYEGSETHT